MTIVVLDPKSRQVRFRFGKQGGTYFVTDGGGQLLAEGRDIAEVLTVLPSDLEVGPTTVNLRTPVGGS